MKSLTETSGVNEALSCTARLDAAISDTNQRLSEARGSQIMAREKLQAILGGHLAGTEPRGEHIDDSSFSHLNKDMINSPGHYAVMTSKSGDVIEARHIIEAVVHGSSPMQGMFAHDIACGLKYLCRLGKKDDAKTDLGKAIKYLGWALDRLELDQLAAGIISEDELRHPKKHYENW